MCKVDKYSSETKTYTVVDDNSNDDEEGNAVKHKVVRKNLRVINRNNPNLKRKSNDKVLALYPDTSVFYPAVVKSSHKKKVRDKYRYLLEFEGEEDPVEPVYVDAKDIIDIRGGT